MKTVLRQYSVSDEIEVFGHIFKGLPAIRNAAGKCAEGVYVIELCEPYPCFDAEDFANEDRRYSNFFFSLKPFAEADKQRLSKLPCRINYCMVNEDMPGYALPAIYYSGEGSKMVFATDTDD